MHITGTVSRLMVALAAIIGFRFWSADVKLAYLESTESLKQRIFIETLAPELELEPEESLKCLSLHMVWQVPMIY